MEKTCGGAWGGDKGLTHDVLLCMCRLCCGVCIVEDFVEGIWRAMVVLLILSCTHPHPPSLPPPLPRRYEVCCVQEFRESVHAAGKVAAKYVEESKSHYNIQCVCVARLILTLRNEHIDTVSHCFTLFHTVSHCFTLTP